MHKSKAADLYRVPKNCPTFGHYVHTAWAINARPLVPECPSLGPWVPTWRARQTPDGFLQNGLCDIPNPAYTPVRDKRYIIETINDMLKNTAQIVHSRHRSVNNFVMNLISALGAYCFFDNKPMALQGYCIEDTKQLSLF